MEVVVWGYGKLGREIVDACRSQLDVIPVAVVSRKVDSIPRSLNVNVHSDLGAAVRAHPGAFVFHARHASHAELERSLLECAQLGVDVVTSTGLFDPASQLADHGASLDEAAVRHGTRIVSAGLQPGFLFDVLPALLLDLVPDWAHLRLTKPSDARTWPVGVRHAQGIGQPPAELPHAAPYPIEASARLLARALGRSVERVSEERTPLLAPHSVQLEDEEIPAGRACGFRQVCVARLEGEKVVVLTWEPTVLVEPDQDFSYRLSVDDGRSLELTMTGKFAQDPYAATAGRMIRAATFVRGMRPGLHVATTAGLTRY